MRPPLPSLTLSRRVKISLGVVVTVIVLLIIAASLVGVYINWLWFGEVGYAVCTAASSRPSLILFVIFGVLMAAILGGNIAIAYMFASAVPAAVGRAAEPRALPGDSRAAQSASFSPPSRGSPG